MNQVWLIVNRFKNSGNEIFVSFYHHSHLFLFFSIDSTCSWDTQTSEVSDPETERKIVSKCSKETSMAIRSHSIFCREGIFSIRGFELIELSLKHLSIQTGRNCIKFIPRRIQPDFVHIMKGNGCNSAVGRIGGKQIMSIGNGCLQMQPIIHEAVHVLGFDHTQCRSDRDNYVEIFFNNIQPQYKFAFDKIKTNNQLVSFDLHSVDLFSKRFFHQ